MGLEGLGSQTHQTYQHVGGKPAVLDLSGALTSGKSLAHRNAAEQWAGSALNLTAQQAVAHKVDKVAANRLKVGPGQGNALRPRGYSHWLGLGTDQVKGSQWSWNNIKQTATANMSQFGKELKAGNFSPKAFVKETLVQRNFQPIKDLFTGKSGASMGQGILATAGVGLAGFDVLKNTHDTYEDAKAREAAGQGDKVNKTKDTLTALGKYGLRDAVSWETAGLGFAVGKAVMPMSVKGIPIGGILFGALGGVTAQKGMNTILKTGDKDPVQQRKALEKARKKMEKEANQTNPKQFKA